MLSEQYSIRELQPTCVPKGYRSAIAMSAIWHASRYLVDARADGVGELYRVGVPTAKANLEDQMPVARFVGRRPSKRRVVALLVPHRKS